MTDSLQELFHALTQDDPQLRETAIRALGTLLLARDNTPDEGLIGTKPNVDSRWNEVLGAIASALRDQDWGVRQSAAEMLIKLHTPLEDDARALLYLDVQSPDPEIRLGAAWSLAFIKDERAVQPLIALLSHEDPIIVASAADALGETGDERAVAALTPLIVHEDEDIQDAARDALERLDVDTYNG